MFLRTRSVLLVLLIMTCLQSYTASNNEFLTHFCLTLDEPVHSNFSTVQGTTPIPEKVNGNWGAWSAASECSVTCGVGQQTQNRKCDNPPPKFGGQACQGKNIKKLLCIIPKNCPADGHWNEWGEWSKCESPNQRTITCRNRVGHQRRWRDCVGRAYEGNYCNGESVDFRQCYDINGCPAGPKEQILGATWSEWSRWSYCKPDCGENSTKTRKRVCEPDISKYSEKNREIFTGKPDIDCGPLVNTEETRPCLNLSPC